MEARIVSVKKKRNPKKVLWKYFAQYIKQRDKNICVTCGSSVSGYNAQAGHYIAKGACGNDYYFSEYNVHCQCAGCNLFLEGNRPKMRAYILKTYGQEILDNLEQNFRKPNKDFPFEDHIKYYKSLVE